MHSEALPKPNAHSEAYPYIHKMKPEEDHTNPYEITSEPILKGTPPTRDGYLLRILIMWFVFTILFII